MSWTCPAITSTGTMPGKGIFRHSHVHKGGTRVRVLWHRHGGTRYRGARDYGRVPEYYVVTCYTPNSQDGLARLDYRMKWEDDFLAYLKKLEENKPVVFCGGI